MKPRLLAAIVFLAVSLIVIACDAQDVDKSRADETLRLAKQEAAKFEFYLGEDRKTKLRLHANSILRWSNPVSTALYGEVFIWTADGRPEVVVSLHKFYQKQRRHLSAEFHSLALGRLSGLRDGQQVWSPSDKGVTFKAVPESIRPADNAGQRLRQMRTLARQFSAEATDRPGF